FSAHVVRVTATKLILAFVTRTGGEFERPIAPCPARIRAAVVAVQINHAARMQRIVLRGDRDREELLDFALAAVGEHAEAAVRTEGLFPDRARLRLIDTLAGVVLLGDARHCAWIFLELGPGHAERVLRVGNRYGVGKQ